MYRLATRHFPIGTVLHVIPPNRNGTVCGARVQPCDVWPSGQTATETAVTLNDEHLDPSSPRDKVCPTCRSAVNAAALTSAR